MQLTTTEQIKQVNPDTTLFLINPYGNDDQSKVKMTVFQVESILTDRFTGHSSYGGDVRSDYVYYSDLLRGCKYVFTSMREANVKLIEIRDGLHQYEVDLFHSQNNVQMCYFYC